MRPKSLVLGLGMFLLLASSTRAQNYTITPYDGQNGTGNVIKTYFGPMLNPVQDWTPVTGFVLSPEKMQWTTPPISADVQPDSLNPCSGVFNNSGPNGEAAITCTSAAPGTANGHPLFSFRFQALSGLLQWAHITRTLAGTKLPRQMFRQSRRDGGEQ